MENLPTYRHGARLIFLKNVFCRINNQKKKKRLDALMERTRNGT